MTEVRSFVKPVALLKLVAIVTAGNLLYQALLLNIDYQDSWFLNNLEYEYFFYVLSYGVLFLYEKNKKSLLTYSILGRIMLFLIPNIKYSYFLGRSRDQHLHFILTSGIVNSNHITYLGSVYTPAVYYAESPLLHTSIATYSIVSGLDIVNIFKYFPFILNLIYPLYIYAIVDKMNFKNMNYLKYSLILSTFSYSTGRTFIVTGVMFVFPFLLGIINQYIDIIRQPKRVNYIVLILLIIGSTLTHPIETLHFLVILMASSIIFNIINGFDKMYIIKLTFVGIIIDLGWILLKEIHFSYLSDLLLPRITVETIAPTASILMTSSLFGLVGVVLSSYGSHALYSIFLFTSFVFLFKNYRETNYIRKEYEFLISFLFVVLGLTFIGYILSIGYGYYQRVFRNYYFVIIIMSGYFFNHIKDDVAKKILPIIFFALILMSTIQLYSHPILVPSASIIFPVEDDVPLVYQGEVNSIYQRELISHVQEHVKSRIASDGVTRNQILGIDKESYYQKYLIWYYPPITDINPYVTPKNYDVFMLHLPGISGAFTERADIRDEKTILKQIYSPDTDLVFSNSQSFLLYHR